jgi:hypothetical protein
MDLYIVGFNIFHSEDRRQIEGSLKNSYNVTHFQDGKLFVTINPIEATRFKLLKSLTVIGRVVARQVENYLIGQERWQN